MSQPDPPDGDQSSSEETLRQWLAHSAQDWLESQSTLWLPTIPSNSPGPRNRGPATPGPPLPRHRLPSAPPARTTDLTTRQRRADRLLWPSIVGALLAVCLGLTPSLTGALLAVLTGAGSVAMATDRLAQSRRPVRGGMTVLWAALVISAAAIGVGGSTISTAVNVPTAVDQPLTPTEVPPALTNHIQWPVPTPR